MPILLWNSDEVKPGFKVRTLSILLLAQCIVFTFHNRCLGIFVNDDGVEVKDLRRLLNVTYLLLLEFFLIFLLESSSSAFGTRRIDHVDFLVLKSLLETLI